MTESPSPRFGGILHAMLTPPAADGPPWVHDLTPPDDPASRPGLSDTFMPPKSWSLHVEAKLSRREMRGWTRLFARMSGALPREVRRMPQSRVANAAYWQRQRNRVKRGRR